jgi:Tfp pilus assembly protein PilN
MRIGINLASRPYQDEGQFYRRWGTALLLSVLLTVSLIFISVRHYQNSQKEWASARRAEAELAELKKDEAQAQQILAEPRNRGTRDQSQFLNASIVRKSFCWTRLMEDLEKMMPPGIRVTSITPTMDQHNRFTLKLEVQGESREGAIELLRNMEKSQHFRSPQLTDEAHPGTNKGGAAQEGIKFIVVTSYLPAESLEGGS